MNGRLNRILHFYLKIMKPLNNILTDISLRVQGVLRNDLQGESSDFKRGFRYAYGLFIVAFMKDKDLPNTNSQWNTQVGTRLLEQQLEKSNKKALQLENKLLSLQSEGGKHLLVSYDSFIHIQKSLVKKFGINEEEVLNIFKQYIK